MLRFFVMLASIANCAGGLVLIATWAAMWERVPIIVLFIGGSLLIQGGYTLLYLHGDLDRWGGLATGALFAGEGLAACVGAAGLVTGIIHNMKTADMEMAPVLAGFLMLAQAILALFFLLMTNRLRPQVNSRSSA
ncbi:MAG TPA: hypothetical protein VLJ83_05655 [Gemmatimonadaceae bacterium]|nr:hypothetical protein [Gemmatimonadaceae bacterium]